MTALRCLDDAGPLIRLLEYSRCCCHCCCFLSYFPTDCDCAGNSPYSLPFLNFCFTCAEHLRLQSARNSRPYLHFKNLTCSKSSINLRLAASLEHLISINSSAFIVSHRHRQLIRLERYSSSGDEGSLGQGRASAKSHAMEQLMGQTSPKSFPATQRPDQYGR